MNVSVQEPISFARDLSRRAAEASDRLSKNDERILAYMREHLSEIPFLTAEALAEAVGVSRAAIVRLSYRLGYEGFTDLRSVARDEFQESEHFQDSSILSRYLASDADALADGTVRQDVQNLFLTHQLVREELPHAAQALSEAGTVYVVGHREDFGLAFLLQRSLHYIRPKVRLVDEGFPDEVYQVGADDAVVALIFRRYPKLAISLLREAKSRGSKTVLITNAPPIDLGTRADHVLGIATDSPMLYRSMVATVAVIQSLVAAVADLEPERTRKSLKAYEDFVQDQDLLLER